MSNFNIVIFLAISDTVQIRLVIDDNAITSGLCLSHYDLPLVRLVLYAGGRGYNNSQAE